MMMMIGDPPRSNPTVIQIPNYDYNKYLEDPTAHIQSPVSSYINSPDINSSHYEKALAALQRYLPSNKDDVVRATQQQHFDPDDFDFDFDFPVDAFSCDEFRIYEFKVKKCARARSHDWTECPFAHPGEKARRRDPRKYHYSGTACPEFRKAGGCKKGDACEYAHGVFECWLHPARYRTQPCKDGTHCKRRVCFFAHTPEQLRTTQEAVMFGTGLSPPSSPKTAGSSPVSPVASMSLVESMRGLAINKKNLGLGGMGLNMGLGLSMSPPAWGLRYGSPQSPSHQTGFMSLPSTPVRAMCSNAKSNLFDVWEATTYEQEPVMERVESGKMLREKIYAKLEKENSLDRGVQVGSSSSDPDVGWVSELVM